jgi:hypothetical protein
VAVLAPLFFGAAMVMVAGAADVPLSETTLCAQAPCVLEENCDCVVPGVTARWRAAYCMAVEQTDDLEQAGVQRCLTRSEPDALRRMKPCTRNEYWKRQICQVTSKRDGVDACVRDKSFIPTIVSRGAGG